MSRTYLNILRLAAFLSTSAAAARIHHSKNICELLNAQLPGLVSDPETTGYNASQTTYYTSQERDLRPACVFRPTNTTQVSDFVKLIVEAGRGTTTPQFAVRGGGHTLFSGAANIDGGITIDMRSLDTFALNEDQTVASLGGGAIWSNIYPQLVPHNLTVLGGRVPGIGVGGFTTGGKYSNAVL
jgi:FAD/FMN-containing dehydrogenase